MTQQPESATPAPAKIRSAAMDLLTGREFSRAELAKKLDNRFDGDSAISAVLDRLQEEGLQSDQRFAEAFLRSRIYRGQGPEQNSHGYSPKRYPRPIVGRCS
jgi:regulatory protein